MTFIPSCGPENPLAAVFLFITQYQENLSLPDSQCIWTRSTWQANVSTWLLRCPSGMRGRLRLLINLKGKRHCSLLFAGCIRLRESDSNGWWFFKEWLNNTRGFQTQLDNVTSSLIVSWLDGLFLHQSRSWTLSTSNNHSTLIWKARYAPSQSVTPTLQFTPHNTVNATMNTLTCLKCASSGSNALLGLVCSLPALPVS